VKEDLFVGLDVGTQGARVVACNCRGDIIASASQAFDLRSEAPLMPGWNEQDPLMWWRSARSCLARLVESLKKESGRHEQIVSLSVDSTSGTILLLDRSGNPIGKALMYSDSRSTVESDRANDAGSEFLAKMGYRFQPGFALPKMMWLAEHRAEDFERAAYIAHPSDYLLACLGCDLGVTDTSNVLKSSYDLIDDGWPEFIERDLGIPSEKLPRVVKSGKIIGEVDADAAAATALPVGTKLVAGATDGTAAFLSSGATEEGDWNSTLGTTLVMRGISRKLVRDPKGRLYCHSHPDGCWLPGAASSVGGECLAKLFKSDELAELDRGVSKSIPNDLLVYPLVRKGERFPFVDPDATGFVIGTPSSDADKYASHLEGVALVERWAMEVFKELGAPTHGQIYASGGAIRSDVWLQLRADVLGRRFNVSSNAESAVGAAILAAAPIAYSSISEAVSNMVRIDRSFEPRSDYAEYFQEKSERLQEACHKRGYC